MCNLWLHAGFANMSFVLLCNALAVEALLPHLSPRQMSSLLCVVSFNLGWILHIWPCHNNNEHMTFRDWFLTWSHSPGWYWGGYWGPRWFDPGCASWPPLSGSHTAHAPRRTYARGPGWSVTQIDWWIEMSAHLHINTYLVCRWLMVDREQGSYDDVSRDMCKDPSLIVLGMDAKLDSQAKPAQISSQKHAHR